ncbi:unnamed protein product [Choristocarpus tenellus]
MSMLGDQQRFGMHGDVMSAKPTDDAGKASLVEEIKSRARGEFSSKNYPRAEMLYKRGLEVTPDDATLHSNLAAVHLGLNRNREALVDAEEAVRIDPGYAKGYFRKGQTLLALERPTEAVLAFEAGAAIDPESKAWGPQLDRARKAIENGKSCSTVPDSKPSTSSSPASSSSITLPSKTSKVVEGGESDAGKSNSSEGMAGGNMKGYKKTVDGRTTTYFNNDLSEEAKRLIGDIAPKRVDPTLAGVAQGGTGGTGGEGAGVSDSNGGSAWNMAGTWESKDMTGWAKDRLVELLKGIEFDAGDGSVEITAVEGLEGDAEITYSRGKKRRMFDFHFNLAWEASLDCGETKGKLVYPDVGQDCCGVYDVECQVNTTTPPAAKGFIDCHVRPEGSGLRNAVLSRLETFAEEFNAK